MTLQMQLAGQKVMLRQLAPGLFAHLWERHRAGFSVTRGARSTPPKKGRGGGLAMSKDEPVTLRDWDLFDFRLIDPPILHPAVGSSTTPRGQTTLPTPAQDTARAIFRHRHGADARPCFG